MYPDGLFKFVCVPQIFGRSFYVTIFTCIQCTKIIQVYVLQTTQLDLSNLDLIILIRHSTNVIILLMASANRLF